VPEDPRKHGFVVTRVDDVNQLTIYTGPERKVYSMTDDQVIMLQHQLAQLIWQYFRLVPR